MKNYLFLLLTFISTSLFAQQTKGGFDPNNRPTIGVVSGKILEKENQKPIDYAVVELVSARDSSVRTGGITDTKGIFNITQIPVGRYILRIKYLGFKTFISTPFLLIPDAPAKDFGVILLSPDKQTLGDVKITAEKEQLVSNLDKRVFNVDKNLASAGGNANDVLRQVPGVTVDIDNKISLRGNDNVTVLIDGKPSSMLGDGRKAVLASIPSNMIESVELVTNPSAKYSAEGMSGIVNIVLKKNKLNGFNGVVNLSGTTIDKYGGGLNLSYRTNKYNLYGGVNYRSEDNRHGAGYINRQNIFTDTSYFVNQTSKQLTKNRNFSSKAGIDFYYNPTTTIGAGVTLSNEHENQHENILYHFLDEAKIETDNQTRDNINTQKNLNVDYNLNFKKLFATPKEELTGDVTFSTINRNYLQNYYQQYHTFNLPESHSSSQAKGGVKSLNAQLDYSHPFNKYSKLETGLKSNSKMIDAKTIALNYFSNDATVNYDPSLSNHFNFTEQINAGYVTYANIFKTFAYQVGARAEYTMQEIYLDQSSFYKKNRYVNFFPSGIIRQPLPKNQMIQLSYSRRINRPGFQSQNPFLDYSDPQNKRQGNANLKPELIHSFELGYQKTGAKYNLTASLYYKHSNDLVIRYKSILPDGTSLTSFTNAYTSDNYGLELIGTNQLTKWWDLVSNFNFFKTKINATNIESDLQNDNFSWFGRINSNIRFWNNAAFQVSANYMAPTVFAQGTSSSMFILSSALKKDFFKNKLTVTISANDILNQMRMEMHSATPTFTQDMLRRRDQHGYTLALSYRFGNTTNEPTKKRGSRSGGGADMNTMEDQ